MGVGCKLVQFVVYCVWFVMMSNSIEKNSAVSEEGHVLQLMVFSGHKPLGQYAGVELLKPFSKTKLGLKLKIYNIQI